MSVRAKVGHIHYFTLETALATLTDAGYTVRGHVLNAIVRSSRRVA